MWVRVRIRGLRSIKTWIRDPVMKNVLVVNWEKLEGFGGKSIIRGTCSVNDSPQLIFFYKLIYRWIK